MAILIIPDSRKNLTTSLHAGFKLQLTTHLQSANLLDHRIIFRDYLVDNILQDISVVVLIVSIS